jgi:type II secretory pathway component PulC
MANIDIDGDGKADFSINISQIITIGALFASIIGSYYTLSAKIDANATAVKKLKENEQKYTWPAQRKLEADFQEIRLEMRDFMKDLEYLQKDKRK